MSEIAFGLPEVQEWARFSNDFNPIHFDLAEAKSVGLDDLVVHGMLILMPIKAAISRACAAAAAAAAADGADREARWMKFHALFRSPIPHGAASELTIRPARTNGLDFRLYAADTRQERFRGSFTPAADQGSWLESHPLPAAAFAVLQSDDARRFRNCYPDVHEAWIALDAIVFSDFMRSRLDVIAQALEQKLASVLGGDPRRGLFVQASHTVHVDTRELGSLDSLPFASQQLRYGMGAPDIVVNPDELIGSVSLPVLIGQKLVMLIEMGLLARPRVQSHPRVPYQ